MGQANVQRWVDDILPLLDATATRSASTTSPPTGCRSSEAPQAYEMFQKKQDGAVKVAAAAVTCGSRTKISNARVGWNTIWLW